MSIHTVLPVLALITVAGADPLGCCMPRRFSGFILNNGGFLPDNDNSSMGVVVDDNVEYHYDYDKRMATAISHRMDVSTGKRGNATVIYDYKNSKMHIITENGTCHTQGLDANTMYSPCIIQNFKYGSTFTMHSGTHSFTVNTFDGMYMGGKLKFSMIVTANECYPVADKLFGDDGKALSVYGVLFTDINPNGVKDALFAVPLSCKAGEGSTVVGKRDLEVLNLGRRPLSFTN